MHQRLGIKRWKPFHDQIVLMWLCKRYHIHLDWFLIEKLIFLRMKSPPPVTFFEAIPRGLQWHSDLNVILFLFWIVFANCNRASIFVTSYKAHFDNIKLICSSQQSGLVVFYWQLILKFGMCWYFSFRHFGEKQPSQCKINLM